MNLDEYILSFLHDWTKNILIGIIYDMLIQIVVILRGLYKIKYIIEQ